MRFLEYVEKLETLKYFLEHKRSGTPRELASRLNVSERTFLRMIQHLRDQGYAVKFNRCRSTYEVEGAPKK